MDVCIFNLYTIVNHATITKLSVWDVVNSCEVVSSNLNA
jgi:hypothetical protein